MGMGTEWYEHGQYEHGQYESVLYENRIIRKSNNTKIEIVAFQGNPKIVLYENRNSRFNSCYKTDSIHVIKQPKTCYIMTGTKCAKTSRMRQDSRLIPCLIHLTCQANMPSRMPRMRQESFTSVLIQMVKMVQNRPVNSDWYKMCQSSRDDPEADSISNHRVARKIILCNLTNKAKTA